MCDTVEDCEPYQSTLFREIEMLPLDEEGVEEVYQLMLDDLDNGVSVDEVDRNGQSLLIACSNVPMALFQLKLPKLLIERGANVNAKYKGMTAVEWAYRRGNIRGASNIQGFIDKFYAPVITTSSITTNETTVHDVKGVSTIKAVSKTIITATTTYRASKRPKLDIVF
jgi:hypothetical protein